MTTNIVHRSPSGNEQFSPFFVFVLVLVSACGARTPSSETQADALETSLTAALISCVDLADTREEAVACQERVRAVYEPLWIAIERQKKAERETRR